MKNVAGGPAGQVAPGSRLRRGVLSLQPAATLSVGAVHLQPHVVAAGVVAGVGHDRGGAVVEGEQVAAVATSPNSAKKSAPWALPVA